MSTALTVNPTSNTSPDPGFGGSAVTTPINTGHGSTVTSDGAGAPGSVTKSCLWSGFPANTRKKINVILKVDWTEDGSLGADGTSSFLIQYSLNGGSSFTNLLLHSDVTSSSSGTASIALPNNQDFTQVQVKDRMIAAGGTTSASITTSISNVRIEAELIEQSTVVMM